MIYLLVFIVFWFVCGALSYGFCLAHFQKKFPSLAKDHYREDVEFALYDLLLGPIALISGIFSGQTHYGLMYRNPHKQDKP